MKVEPADAQWLHEHAEVSFEELSEFSGLPPELLQELVEYGALVPVDPQIPIEAQARIDVQSTRWRFTADCILNVRTVSRLREDFELDANALSVALTLVERIHGLEAQLRDLQTQLPRPRSKRSFGS